MATTPAKIQGEKRLETAYQGASAWESTPSFRKTCAAAVRTTLIKSCR